MAKKPAEPLLILDPAIRPYVVICLLALLVVLLVLLDQGLGEWALLLVVLGCVCLLLQVRFGPPLLLLALVWLTLSEARGLEPRRLAREILLGRRPLENLQDTPGLSVTGLVLGVAMLVYSAGFYRLHSLTHHLFPVDPRRKRWVKALQGRHGSRGEEETEVPALERRPVTAIRAGELPLLLMSAGLWAVLAWLFWEWLYVQNKQFGFNLVSTRGLLLFWLFGTGFLLTSALLSYLGQALAGVEASAVWLQDQLWQQTQHEQSRINRWLVGARLRWQRKEAK